MIAACQPTQKPGNEPEVIEHGTIKCVQVQFADFAADESLLEGGTLPQLQRSIVDPVTTPNNVHFSWEINDQLAIYAGSSSSGNGDLYGLTSFVVETVEPSGNTATFKQTGYSLIKNNTYVAFFPYDASQTNRDAVHIDYNGQRQIGNGTYGHLGAKDFQYSPAVQAEETESEGEITQRTMFELKHLGVVVRFRFKGMPAGNYTNLRLIHENMLSKGVVHNLVYDNVKIDTASGNLPYMDIALDTQTGENITSGIAIANEQEILTVYAMLPAQDWSATNSLRVVLTEQAHGAVIAGVLTGGLTKVVTGKDMKAGKAYGINVDFTNVRPTPPADVNYVYMGQDINGHRIYYADRNFGASSPTDPGTPCQFSDYDQVTAAWGENWRTPTTQEMEALFHYMRRINDDTPDDFNKGGTINPHYTWVFDNTNTNTKETITWNGFWPDASTHPHLDLPMIEDEEQSGYYRLDFWSSTRHTDGNYAVSYFIETKRELQSGSPVYQLATGRSNKTDIASQAYIRPIYVGPVNDGE